MILKTLMIRYQFNFMTKRMKKTFYGFMWSAINFIYFYIILFLFLRGKKIYACYISIIIIEPFLFSGKVVVIIASYFFPS